MQPLNVSIFGPITTAYCRQINEVGHHAEAAIDQAQFGSFYAKAHKSLTPIAARKAFVDCGMTVSPNPNKILSQIPGVATNTPAAVMQSGLHTETTCVLQEVETPHSDKAFNTMLDAYKQTTDPRDEHILKWKLTMAFNEPCATKKILLAQEERNRAVSKKSQACKQGW